jgi:hypothetical protein
MEIDDDTFRKVKQLDPTFELKDIGVSTPVVNVRTADGRLYEVIRGCTPHYCGGTLTVIVRDTNDGAVFLLKQTSNENEVIVYGTPDSLARQVLVCYMRLWVEQGR